MQNNEGILAILSISSAFFSKFRVLWAHKKKCAISRRRYLSWHNYLVWQSTASDAPKTGWLALFDVLWGGSVWVKVGRRVETKGSYLHLYRPVVGSLHTPLGPPYPTESIPNLYCQPKYTRFRPQQNLQGVRLQDIELKNLKQRYFVREIERSPATRQQRKNIYLIPAFAHRNAFAIALTVKCATENLRKNRSNGMAKIQIF